MISVVHFVKNTGRKPATGGRPTEEDLRQALDSYTLETGEVHLSLAGDTVFLSGRVASREILEKTVIAVGNFFGIAVVDVTTLTIAGENEVAGHAANGQWAYYVVKHGDTLQTISEKIYGEYSEKLQNRIFEANYPVLSAPEHLYLGQVLRLPNA